MKIKLFKYSVGRAFLRVGVCVALVAGVNRARASELYQEQFRPLFHFTPERNWMNDPNGLVYYEGEYHLFYQHNPFGDKWGHMSWGHAVSKDLIHWEHLPVALAEEKGVMVFSGSAIVDWKNTTGFGRDGKPPLVAIYTGHHIDQPRQNEQIAYSNDKGRTWTKYEHNPVLDIGERDFRDPKVFWHEPAKSWVMVVAWPIQRKVRFYASPNLTEWTHLTDFGPAGSTKGIWECPDLFQLSVNGKSKWVLIVNVGSGAPAGGSGGQYFVGDFDGKQFTLDPSFPKPQPESIPKGKILADFEADDYGGWRATGDAFAAGPAHGKIGGQQAVDGFRGRGLVNSFNGGDAGQGTLTSPEFEITADFLSFLVGGGNHPGLTCLNLLINGRVTRTATGDNAERLTWKSWDVRELRGKQAVIEIVDRYTGGWGHINVDQIMMSGAPAHAASESALWMDYGPDYYAAVTWSDIPRRDGRRLALGWMSNWQYANDVPTSPWRSAMSLPRELSLRQTAEGIRLSQQPVREFKKLRGKDERLKNASIDEANSWISNRDVEGSMIEIVAEFEGVNNVDRFGLSLRGTGAEETRISCDAGNSVLKIDRGHSGLTGFNPAFAGTYAGPLAIHDGHVSLHVLVDTSSVEIFANDGEVVMTELRFPEDTHSTLALFAAGNPETLRVRNLEVWKIRSVWK